jgi:hypothetical protein
MCYEVAVMLGGSKCVSRSGKYVLGGGRYVLEGDSYIGTWQLCVRRC